MRLLRSYLKYKLKLWRRLRYQIGELLAIQIALGFIFGAILNSARWWGVLMVLLFALGGRKKLFILSFFMGLGFVYAELSVGFQHQQQVESFFEERLELLGTVVGDPQVGSYYQQVTLSSGEIPAKALLRLPLYPRVTAGEEILVEVKLEQPESSGDFDYQQYLETQGISYVGEVTSWQVTGRKNLMLALPAGVRQWVKLQSERFLDSQKAGLLNGLVIGSRENLGTEFKESLAATGTSHIVAVSGTNVTLVLTLVLSAAGVFPRRKLLFLSQFFLIFFLLVVGFDNLPALRAAIMGLIIVWSQLSGRPNAVYLSLVYAVALMLLLNPLVWGSISFQLSVSAFLGMVMFSGSFKSALPKLPWGISDNLITTFAVLITTLPITVFNFGTTSLISFLVNVLVLPFVPIATILGTLANFIAIFSQLLAGFIYFLVGVILEIVILVISFFGSLSFAATDSLVIGVGLNIFLLFLFITLDVKSFHERFTKPTF